MTKTIKFWFEFASTYSYLAAMRVDKEAAKRNVEVEWMPFPLGPIFGAQGWTTSPFNIFPAKGANMWRDMERKAAQFGLAFKVPDADFLSRFPQNGIAAARLTLVGLSEGWGRDFARSVYASQFGEHADIADPAVLSRLVSEAGGDPIHAYEASQSAEIKARYRANSEAANAAGIYGAPSFTVGDELFWGHDRLDDAIEWAVSGKL